MDLDAGAVDEEFVRHTVHSGELGEDALPHTSLGPAPETVVERLLRPVDILRAVSPAATALQRMDDPRQHAPVIDPRHPACVVRQERLDPCPLFIRKPEEIRHPLCLLAGDS